MITTNLKLDYSLIHSVEVDGVDTRDYPDFSDAYISNAWYGDREMSDEELDILNEDGDYVWQSVYDTVF